MIKARASGSKVNLYFMKKGRQARHRIPRNSCSMKNISSFENKVLLKPMLEGVAGVAHFSGHEQTH